MRSTPSRSRLVLELPADPLAREPTVRAVAHRVERLRRQHGPHAARANPVADERLAAPAAVRVCGVEGRDPGGPGRIHDCATACSSLSPWPKNAGEEPIPPKFPHPRMSRETSIPLRPSAVCSTVRSSHLSWAPMRSLRGDLLRFLDSYASLLVLLLANFFLLELVDDPRWGAIGSTLLSALALIVAISDPDTGHTRHAPALDLDRRLRRARAARPLRQLGVARRPDLPPAGRAARDGDAADHAQPRARATGASRTRPCSARSARTCSSGSCSPSSTSR